MIKSIACLVLAVSITLAFAGCGSSAQHRQDEVVAIQKAGRHGPPPHAPAHGYRHKHRNDGVELVFDSGRGVYVVINYPNHYFLDGVYFRLHDSGWFVSTSIRGEWKAAKAYQVPKGLLSAGNDGDDRKHGRKRGHDK